MSQNEDLSFPIKSENFSNSGAHNSKLNLATAPGDNYSQNSSFSQSMANGPVVENIKEQSAKTQADLSNLAATRTTPTYTAATGQPLTQYHSFFYSLLSWEHPRASGIAYLTSVLIIFATRYLNIFRYSLKVTYVVLGITLLSEITGKLLFSHGFTSQIRPKRYYTVSRETLNLLIGDVHELINFFVIQAQQIIFAENLFVSLAAFVSAFISYFLVKFVPIWGLSLLGSSALFLGTLAYKSNQEFIDNNIEYSANIINQQTEQIKVLISDYAAHTTKQTKALVGDYSVRAQEIITSRSPLSSPRASEKKAKNATPGKETYLKSEDFPKVPLEDFKSVKNFDSQSPLRDEQNLIST
ncbi:hypothetical protein HI914_07151 [Erysiphe necator]|nr:hypothetical protein HI914_07151 [Erysiphe necator]